MSCERTKRWRASLFLAYLFGAVLGEGCYYLLGLVAGSLSSGHCIWCLLCCGVLLYCAVVRCCVCSHVCWGVLSPMCSCVAFSLMKVFSCVFCEAFYCLLLCLDCIQDIGQVSLFLNILVARKYKEMQHKQV